MTLKAAIKERDALIGLWNVDIELYGVPSDETERRLMDAHRDVLHEQRLKNTQPHPEEHTMSPQRYSIYSNQALETALDARIDYASPEGDGFRSRSSLIAAMVERYHETCRRHIPNLTLNEWLLVFDALHGVWTVNSPAITTIALAQKVEDAIILNDAHTTWGISATDAGALVHRLGTFSFAGKIAVIDAAERFWSLNIQPDTTPTTPEDPLANWRAPIYTLVGRLAGK